jgi:hypothetical protein
LLPTPGTVRTSSSRAESAKSPMAPAAFSCTFGSKAGQFASR